MAWKRKLNTLDETVTIRVPTGTKERAKRLIDSTHLSETSVLRAVIEAGFRELEKNEGLAV